MMAETMRKSCSGICSAAVSTLGLAFFLTRDDDGADQGDEKHCGGDLEWRFPAREKGLTNARVGDVLSRLGIGAGLNGYVSHGVLVAGPVAANRTDQNCNSQDERD